MSLLPKSELIVKRTAPVLTEANSLEITTDAGFASAGEILRRLKEAEKYVHQELDAGVEEAHKAHKNAVADRAKFLEPIEKASKWLSQRMGAWTEEKRRAKEEADRQERARLAAEAEAARKAAAVKAEEEKRIADEAAAAQLAAAAEVEEEDPIEADRLRHQAAQAQAEAQEQVEHAQTVMAEPLAVTPIVSTYAPPPPGISAVETWKGEVVDLMALVLAVAEKRAPLSLLAPIPKEVNDLARGLKTEGVVNGIRVWKETNMRVGRVG